MTGPIRTAPKGGADLIKAIEALPPLPTIALRVIQVAQDARSSASDLALIVSADPGLSARILRIANSAAYRRTREVTSVQEALVVLGFIQARNVAVSSAIASAYSSEATDSLFRIDEFWRHSMTVAFRAAELATRVRNLDIPSAYTAGILHNMGRLAMFYADPEGLDQAVAEAIRLDVPLHDVEDEMLGYNHAELGGLLAIKWRLPADIRDAIARHHQENLPPKSLAGLVSQADQFCARNGLHPGYIVPPSAARLPDKTPDFRHIAERVEELMALVNGTPVPVKVAPLDLYE